MHSPYAPTQIVNQERRSGRVFSYQDLKWSGDVLRLGRLKLAEIRPDAVWPDMWRVVVPFQTRSLLSR
jgi:hypothetical protein